MDTALLIVDMQVDFSEVGALPVPGFEDIVPVINNVIKQLSSRVLTICSLDWHYEPDSKHFDNWPVHCLAGSTGSRLYPGLEVPENVLKVYKGQEGDGYSAFDGTTFDGTTSHEEPLHELLQKAGVKSLYITGVATEYCIKSTVLDAIKLGYSVIVVQNAIAGIKPDTSAATIKEFEQLGVGFTVIT